jgi:hypothetical protein
MKRKWVPHLHPHKGYSNSSRWRCQAACPGKAPRSLCTADRLCLLRPARSPAVRARRGAGAPPCPGRRTACQRSRPWGFGGGGFGRCSGAGRPGVGGRLQRGARDSTTLQDGGPRVREGGQAICASAPEHARPCRAPGAPRSAAARTSPSTSRRGSAQAGPSASDPPAGVSNHNADVGVRCVRSGRAANTGHKHPSPTPRQLGGRSPRAPAPRCSIVGTRRAVGVHIPPGPPPR